MTPSCKLAPGTAALDYDSTLIGALELSSKKWVFAVQLPGSKKHTRQVVEPSGSALVEMIERLKARSLAAGRPILRMILTYEAGRDGFWLARFLQRRGVEVHVMQASSLPVDRRARRAKTDMIDVEMLVRTFADVVGVGDEGRCTPGCREEHTIASQTAALRAFAQEQQCDVPSEWVFEDEGYSGASLVRPGLERVRDLAAEGLIEAVLVYAPDRLSRRYAHQVLLIEEFARVGVETLFVRSPRATTPEDQLLLQFQGMIAEYERAQILERSRRGKRHRAQQGQVNVLSGAPFGYRYMRKTDQSAAYYEVIENQARIVRMVYELYTVQGRSIGAITRHLNEQQVPTCKGLGRWERSTVWAMLGTRAARQNSDRTAPADHAAHMVARRRSPSQQRKPRTSGRRLDCDSRTGAYQCGSFRARC